MQSEELITYLQTEFGFADFRPGQAEIINALLEQRDTLAVLPTGAGKTLIYQLVGRLRGGLTIVVSPLLALMQDQVARLNYLGEARVVAVNSNLQREERARVLQQLASYHFVFMAPEMLQRDEVLQALAQCKINLLVIDEAHTIINWGPDFRPDYLKLPQVHQQLGQPQLLLLTATASDRMVGELQTAFKQVQNWFVYQQSADRPNIHLHTEQLANNNEKKERLFTLVQQLQGPGIIYVSSRKLANNLAEELRQELGVRATAFHAGQPYLERYKIQQQYMQGQLEVIVATSAFGMGIDKNDIRYVIHYHPSQDLANYLQEIGRAGRDGQPAVAISLYTQGDEQIQLQMITSSIPSAGQVEGYWAGKLTEQQLGVQNMRLLDGYKALGYQKERMIELLQMRLQQRQRNLWQLITYFQQTEQLRTTLLIPFSHQAEISDENESSGATNLDLKVIGLLREQPQAATEQSQIKWQQRLQQLFNLS